jgi:hypothetical protein
MSGTPHRKRKEHLSERGQIGLLLLAIIIFAVSLAFELGLRGAAIARRPGIGGFQLSVVCATPVPAALEIKRRMVASSPCSPHS